MKADPLKNKWTEDYFDAFKKDIKSAIEYLKQQFDEGIEYDCKDIDKAIRESFPDIFAEDGVSNYRLKSVYLPVLDRKFISKFNPKKTCISVCGNTKFEFDEKTLVKKSISEVKRLKDYHKNNPYGQKENIGEYNIFQNIEIDNFMLESYSFGLDSEGDYYLILWFTPQYLFNGVRKHVYWYEKNHNGEWY